MDLSNVEKLLIDLIFDSRFDGRTIDGQLISNLAIDDKFITDLLSIKRPADKHSIQVYISLLPL
jgi:hypothetical protein